MLREERLLIRVMIESAPLLPCCSTNKPDDYIARSDLKPASIHTLFVGGNNTDGVGVCFSVGCVIPATQPVAVTLLLLSFLFFCYVFMP